MAGPCPENSPHGWWESIAAAVILVPDWHVRLLLSAYRTPGTVPAWLAQCRMNPAPRLGQGACCPSCTSHTVPPGLPAPREKSRGTPSTCSQTSASPARAGLGWGRWTQPGRTHRHTHTVCVAFPEALGSLWDPGSPRGPVRASRGFPTQLRKVLGPTVSTGKHTCSKYVCDDGDAFAVLVPHPHPSATPLPPRAGLGQWALSCRNVPDGGETGRERESGRDTHSPVNAACPGQEGH